jgi:hypothetical protein
MAKRKQRARSNPRYAWEPMRKATAFKEVAHELVALSDRQFAMITNALAELLLRVYLAGVQRKVNIK